MFLTYRFEMLFKPSDSKDDDNYVDESQVSQNRNEV